MRIVDPTSGRSYIEKRRQRFNEPGEPRSLTFSCYPRYRFLKGEQVREHFRKALQAACRKYGFQIWDYVLMPEHAHLLVYPGERPEHMAAFLQALKEPTARRVVAHIKSYAPAWLPRLRVRDGRRWRHRIWQPGGGYDRNITSAAALRSEIDYIHNNPVRHGLVTKAEEWEWSSARWFAGMRPVKMEMDDMVLRELARDGDLTSLMRRKELGEVKQ